VYFRLFVGLVVRGDVRLNWGVEADDLGCSPTSFCKARRKSGSFDDSQHLDKETETPRYPQTRRVLCE